LKKKQKKRSLDVSYLLSNEEQKKVEEEEEEKKRQIIHLYIYILSCFFCLLCFLYNTVGARMELRMFERFAVKITHGKTLVCFFLCIDRFLIMIIIIILKMIQANIDFQNLN